MESLISAKDLPFEYDLLHDDTDLDLWRKYYANKAGEPLRNKMFVIERAVTALPRSEELWTIYTDLLVHHMDGASFYHNREQYRAVNRVFERALSLLYTSTSLWSRYLSFLDRQHSDVTRVRKTFDRALVCLPTSQHKQVWAKYLEFAAHAGGITRCRIYERYLQFEGDALDYIDYFKEDDPQTAVRLLETAGKSVREFKMLVEVLLSPRAVNSVRPDRMERTVKEAVFMWPDQLSFFTLKLIDFYVARGMHERARAAFDSAIMACTTAHDFVRLYDAYTEYEETQMLDLQSDQELDFRMRFFENLLAARPVLLNEMELRRDTNNVDSWVDRIALHEDRLDKKLQTYALAFNKINPLKAHSKKWSLVDLWAKYADEYASRNDWGTANLIYSKATQSKFKSVDELAELYIRWAELTLSADLPDADQKAVEIVENGISSEPSSQKLWGFYVDLLDSFVEDKTDADAIQKVKDAYERMIIEKVATPSTFIALADFLQRMSRFEESYKVYESGLDVFGDSLIRFELWNVYLAKVIEYNADTERIRALFEQCIPQCPVHLLCPIITLYSRFEQTNGLLLKSVQILKRGISTLVAADVRNSSQDVQKTVSSDKHTLSLLLVQHAKSIGDEGLLREAFEFILRDKSLSTAHLNEVTFQFIALEKSLGQYSRVRQLFEFLAKSTNPVTNSALWHEWELFEVDHGSEETFKEMLRFKRRVSENFSNKEYIGFVKKKEEKKEEPINPDQIELDM